MVEDNGNSWVDGGNQIPVPIVNSTGENMDSILHGYAHGFLTQKETEQALSDLMKGKGIPNGSNYAELWMQAPEQIG